MSIAQFSLVKKIPVDIVRRTQGSYIEGHWVEGEEQTVTVEANIHPFSDYQVMMLPESDRSKSWMWMFTADLVRPKKEGVDGNDADRLVWDGDFYEVRAVQRFSMSVQDHYEAKLCRVELTPDTLSP